MLAQQALSPESPVPRRASKMAFHIILCVSVSCLSDPSYLLGKYATLSISTASETSNVTEGKHEYSLLFTLRISLSRRMKCPMAGVQKKRDFCVNAEVVPCSLYSK